MQCLSHNQDTDYSQAHHFCMISNAADYQRQVPITDYENLQPSIEAMTQGKQDVLFSGKTIAFELTSGSTAAQKLIPYSAQSLGELRLLPEFRTRPDIVRNGFRALRALAPDYPHWFTSIAVDNKVARRLLEAGLKGMPVYRPLGEIVTLALPSASRRSQTALHACTPEEVPELVNFFNHQAQRFQYAPVLSETWLRQLDGSNGLRLQDFQLIRRNGRLCACFALWDQRSLKQTVVHGYRFPLAQLRRGYNLLARLGGRLTLPPAGQAIDYLFIAFLATASDLEASAFRRLIDSALALTSQRRIPCAMLGLATDNPLLQNLAHYRAQTYRTCIESVTWPDHVVAGIVPSLSCAERIVQPEIALL